MKFGNWGFSELCDYCVGQLLPSLVCQEWQSNIAFCATPKSDKSEKRQHPKLSRSLSRSVMQILMSWFLIDHKALGIEAFQSCVTAVLIKWCQVSYPISDSETLFPATITSVIKDYIAPSFQLWV